MSLNPIDPSGLHETRAGLRTLHYDARSAAKVDLVVQPGATLIVDADVADQLERASAQFKPAPDTPDLVPVDDDTVEALDGAGDLVVTVDDADDPSPAAGEVELLPEGEFAEAFDPQQHTIAEVLAFVDEHPGSALPLHSLESAAGDAARKTLLAKLAERAAADEGVTS